MSTEPKIESKAKSKNGVSVERIMDKSKREEIKKRWLDLLLASTAHGIPRIFARENHKLIKSTWITLLTLSTMLCCYFIWLNITKYIEYDVVTTIKVVNENPAKFPTVTICNTNFIVNQKSLNYSKTIGSDSLNSTSDIYLSYDFFSFYLSSKLASSNMSDAELKEYGLMPYDMIISCIFNYYGCNQTQWTWYFDSFYGSCFRFNAGIDSNGNQVNDLYLTNNGILGGLILRFYVPYINDPWSFTRKLGVHVFIHNKSYTPTVFNGFDVSVDAENQVAVSRTSTTSLPSPYSSCVDNITTFGSIFTDMFSSQNLTYTQTNCFLYCLQREAAKVCDCYSPSFPHMTFGKQSCADNFNQFMCWILEFRNFYYSLDSTSRCRSECPLECSREQYSISATNAAFTTDQYYFKLVFDASVSGSDFMCLNELNMTCGQVIDQVFAGNMSMSTIADSLKRKTASLTVYYDDLVYTEISQEPKIETIDMIANIGGLLGLFIGISFLSFVELLELAMHCGIVLLKRRKVRTSI